MTGPAGRRASPAGRRASPRARLGAVLSPEPYTGRGAPLWAQGALITFCALLFGFQFVAFKAAFHGFGPVTLLAVRVVIALPLTVAIMRWARVPIRVSRRDLLLVAVPAGLLMGSQIFFMFAVHRLTASLTSTIVSTIPIFSLGLGFLFAIERVGLLGVVGTLAGVAGVAIATGAATGDLDALGLLLMLGSNFSYGLSLVVLKRMALRVSSAIFLIVMLAESALVLTPLAGALEGFSVTWTWKAAFAVLYIGTLGQAVAYIGVMTLMRFGGVFQSTLVTPLIPVWAIFFAVLLLGEPLLGRELVGGALIIGGVLLAIAPVGRRRV